MKKSHVVVLCIVVLAVIVSLGAVVFAMPDKQDTDKNSAAEDSRVVFMKKEAAVTGSVAEVKNSTHFEDYGYKIEELSDSELSRAKANMISRDKALEIAVSEVEQMAKSEAKSINAVAVRFTDPETAAVPNTDISLKDAAVWLVTFNDVTVERGGPAGDYDRSIVADVNVIIDIATGEVLETISHAA